MLKLKVCGAPYIQRGLQTYKQAYKKTHKKQACLQGKLSVGSEEYKTKEEEKNMCLVFFKITFF